MNRIGTGRIAAVDYGTVRMGVAITDRDRTIASPLAVHTRRGAAGDADFFRRLAADEDVALFVVGLPVHLSGRESGKSWEAREFAAWLATTTGVRVSLFDERFTTTQADEYLAQGEFTKKRRKARRDMLAAQVLLTAFLEAGCPDDAAAEPLDDRRPPHG